jgi:hypothetical protein
MHLDQIQTSKITIDTIGKLNSFIFINSSNTNKVRQAYETIGFPPAPNEIDSDIDPWKYKINQYGFRGDDWNFKKSPAFFGCSVTFGIGVKTPTAEIIQSKYTDIVIPNLGAPGGSIVNIIKTFVAFVKLHPVSHAFIILPQPARFFYPKLVNNAWDFMNVLPNFNASPMISEKCQKQIMQIWTDGPSISYTLDYISWAEEVAKAHDVKIFWSTWDQETVDFLSAAVKENFIKWPKSITRDSRDRMHPGQKNHQQFAEICWDIIQKT